MDWNEPTKAEQWRTAWAETVNATLERYGLDDRIDHRSFERQGKEEIPTVHLGVAAAQMERKGIATNRGSLNREAYIFNVKLKKLQTRIDELANWLIIETKKGEPTNLVHMIRRILVRLEERRKTNRYPTRDDSRIFVETLDFLTTHGIETIDDFKEKAAGLTSRRDVEKFAQMRFRIEILLRQEERRVQKKQQGQRQPRTWVSER